uniref:CACTA en-spm transposon protein n=1 Tax=Cucumis melo TaxID=3656 RepID=A0A9I9EG96_CUCME
MKKTGQLVFTRNQKSVPVELECLFDMVGNIIQSTKTVMKKSDKLKRSCACDSGSGSVSRVICVYARGIRFTYLQVEIEFPVSLGLPVKSVNFESRQIQVQKSVVRRLHAIFQSKVAGCAGGGVTCSALHRFVNHQILTSFKEFRGDYHRHFYKYIDPEQTRKPTTQIGGMSRRLTLSML